MNRSEHTFKTIYAGQRCFGCPAFMAPMISVAPLIQGGIVGERHIVTEFTVTPVKSTSAPGGFCN